jgi:hypothetical protein
MDTVELGMTFMAIGFGSLLCVSSIVIATYGIIWLTKQCKKKKDYQIVSVSEEYRDIWVEAIAITKYEKNWEIIDKEKYRDRIDLHVTRMLAMILD